MKDENTKQRGAVRMRSTTLISISLGLLSLMMATSANAQQLQRIVTPMAGSVNIACLNADGTWNDASPECRTLSESVGIRLPRRQLANAACIGNNAGDGDFFLPDGESCFNPNFTCCNGGAARCSYGLNPDTNRMGYFCLADGPRQCVQDNEILGYPCPPQPAPAGAAECCLGLECSYDRAINNTVCTSDRCIRDGQIVHYDPANPPANARECCNGLVAHRLVIDDTLFSCRIPTQQMRANTVDTQNTGDACQAGLLSFTTHDGHPACHTCRPNTYPHNGNIGECCDSNTWSDGTHCGEQAPSCLADGTPLDPNNDPDGYLNCCHSGTWEEATECGQGEPACTPDWQSINLSDDPAIKCCSGQAFDYVTHQGKPTNLQRYCGPRSNQCTGAPDDHCCVFPTTPPSFGECGFCHCNHGDQKFPNAEEQEQLDACQGYLGKYPNSARCQDYGSPTSVFCQYTYGADEKGYGQCRRHNNPPPLMPGPQ